jgi:glutaryl-CoA dehydrogenase
MSAPAPATDLLALDGQLSEDDRLLRETVRRFAEERLRPNIADWFDAGTLPRELAVELGKLGLLGMHLTGYGCAGATAVQYGLVCHELEAVDSGLRSLVSVQGSLAMYAIRRYGSPEQKQECCPGWPAARRLAASG